MKSILSQLSALLFLLFCSIKAFPAENFTSISTRLDSISEQTKYQPLQFKVGFTSGWKAPYGTGLDFSFLINEVIDVNIGCGISISGTKIGLGTRFYPIRNKNFAPMIGVYLFNSAGQNSITVSFNTDSAKYRIKPDKAVQIDAGFRYRFGKGHYIITGVGYSIPFKGENAEYLSGSTLDTVRSMADGLRIGGFSINFGILIKLSKGYYRKL
jgi:hypothetical protein